MHDIYIYIVIYTALYVCIFNCMDVSLYFIHCRYISIVYVFVCMHLCLCLSNGCIVQSHNACIIVPKIDIDFKELNKAALQKHANKFN